MKRSFTILICFLLSSVSNFASPTIYKTWIGENLEYLEITEEKANFEFGFDLYDYDVTYKDSTLTLIDYTYKSRKIGRRHEKYVYKVLRLTNDSLIISPLNERASRLIHGKTVFIFVDKSLLYKTDLKFQKIFFSAGVCFGECPALKIEIDSTGLTYFLGEYHTGTYLGLYKGQLTKVQLDSLIEILKVSELDKFPIRLNMAMDASTYNFKFSYNDKVKTSVGDFVPYFTSPLLNYLMTIYKKIEFEEIEDTYEFGK